jgi:hypothetical protein
MSDFNYHNKKFKAVSNSKYGEIGSDLIFTYQQNETIISCTYSGDRIVKGHLLGSVASNGCLHFSYHQVNIDGQLKTGKCTSHPKRMSNGKIRLHEFWEWTSGNKQKGTSILEEI